MWCSKCEQYELLALKQKRCHHLAEAKMSIFCYMAYREHLVVAGQSRKGVVEGVAEGGGGGQDGGLLA